MALTGLFAGLRVDCGAIAVRDREGQAIRRAQQGADGGDILAGIAGDGDLVCIIEGIGVPIEGRTQTIAAAGAVVEDAQPHVHHVGLLPAVGRGVKKGCLRPVAVEAHVGQAQGHGLVPAGGRQGHEALHIDAVGEVPVQVGFALLRKGEGDIDRLRILSQGNSGRSGEGILLRRQRTGLLGNVAPAILRHDRFRQHADGDLIGDARRALQALDLEGERPLAVLTGSGLCLGAAAVLAHKAGVGSRGAIQVDETRALLPGRRRIPVLIQNRDRRAHEEVLHQSAALLGGHVEAVQLLVDVLVQNGRRACQMRRCHRGTAEGTIGVVQHRGIDIAARGGNLRLQLQIRGNAPGGEIAHLAAESIRELADIIRAGL